MKWIIGGIILLSTIFILNIPGGSAFEFHGFADVSFSKGTKTADMFRNGDFSLGTLDLYFAEELDNTEILSELTIEQGEVINLRRITIGYSFNDALKVRVGSFHTPLGFWNILYHHGAQLQPTIERPEFFNFEDEGGIIPAHTVGIHLSGQNELRAGKLEYGIIIGNGPKITASRTGDTNILSPNNVSDNNPGKALAFYTVLSPEMVMGLKVGVSGHISRIQSDDTVIDTEPVTAGNQGITDVNQTILGASVMYSFSKLYLLGEYFSMQNKDNIISSNAGSNISHAYYGLVTYTYQDKWVPYLLYAVSLKNKADPYLISLGAVNDHRNLSAGLMYNISYRSCVKGEIRSIKDGNTNWNEYALQWALAF